MLILSRMTVFLIGNVSKLPNQQVGSSKTASLRIRCVKSESE